MFAHGKVAHREVRKLGEQQRPSMNPEYSPDLNHKVVSVTAANYLFVSLGTTAKDLKNVRVWRTFGN